MKRASRQDAPRRFRSDKRHVRYAGRRWRLVEDRGRWLYIVRRGIGQWIPGECAR